MEASFDTEAARQSGSALGRERDRELVRLVGRHGVMTVEQAMRATGVGRTATYRRAAALIEAGLLGRLDLLRSEPSLLHATRDGLRYAKLAMPVAAISPGAVDHWLRCVTVALNFGERYVHDRVLTERDIVSREILEGRSIARAELGSSRSYRAKRFHRADLAVFSEAGVIAVEVELTPKAPRRLEELIRAWRHSYGRRQISEVRYLCEPGQTRRLVERIVKKVKADNFVQIAEAPERGRDRRG
jgi:hypothetical protein